MLSVLEILEACGGKIEKGAGIKKIKGVSIDSRTAKKGELFIAVPGENFDGHRFVREAAANGVSVIMVSRKIPVPAGITVIRVKDTVKALGDLARFYRLRFPVHVIAVTGSAGKTTVKDMIAGVLSAKYKVLKNQASYNNQFGVPLTIFQLRKRHQILVLELGTNQKGDIAYLASIARPDTAVFTNIGQSHLRKLKNPLGVFREKSRVLDYTAPGGTVIYNADDAYLSRLADEKRFRRVSYSVCKRSAYKATRLLFGKALSFCVKRKFYRLKVPIRHNVLNAIPAIICGEIFKVPYNKIYKKISLFINTDKRQNILRVKKCVVIDDTYNANPLSFQSAVRTLTDFPSAGLRVAVCADMLELGSGTNAIHRELGRFIGLSGVDVLITFGKAARHIAAGAKKVNSSLSVHHFSAIEKAAEKAQTFCRLPCVILVKGSRGMKMERVVEALKK